MAEAAAARGGTRRRRSGVAGVLGVVAALLLLVAPVPSTASTATVPQSNCSPHPLATDGRLVLDQPRVRPGQTVIAILSDFRQWPQALIGGGSGETFLSCTPVNPYGALAINHDSAAFFLVHVPATAGPGAYTVSVAFAQGSTSDAESPVNVRRLDATLTVSSAATPVVGAASRLHHVAATVGHLVAPSAVSAGSWMTVSVRGVPRIGILSEYDQLRFVASIGGISTPVTGPFNAPASFRIHVPSGLSVGSHRLMVTGVVDSVADPPQVVAWTRTVQVVAAPATPSALPATGA